MCLALLFLGVTEGGPPCSYFCKFGMYIIPSMYLLLLFFHKIEIEKKKKLVMYSTGDILLTIENNRGNGNENRLDC